MFLIQRFIEDVAEYYNSIPEKIIFFIDLSKKKIFLNSQEQRVPEILFKNFPRDVKEAFEELVEKKQVNCFTKKEINFIPVGGTGSNFEFVIAFGKNYNLPESEIRKELKTFGKMFCFYILV